MPFFPNYELLMERIGGLTKKYSKEIFDFLIPYLTESLYEYINTRKQNNKGRKPCKKLITTFLNACFYILDNAPKIETLETHYRISRGSYYRFLRILYESRLLEQFHKSLLNGTILPTLLLLDATHIRSVNGSEGVNYGYKEHGKKALKLSILTGINKVIYLKAIHLDNLPDHTAFKEMSITNPAMTPTDVLADRGYVGKDFKTECFKNGYRIVTPHKKGQKSHPSLYEKILLKRYRSRVEHVFSQLKRFRALQVKYNRSLWCFSIFVELGMLIVSIHNGIVKGGLKYGH